MIKYLLQIMQATNHVLCSTLQAVISHGGLSSQQPTIAVNKELHRHRQAETRAKLKIIRFKRDNTQHLISEVNLSAFIYRLFHEDFSSIVRMNKMNTEVYSFRQLRRNHHETVSK